MAGIFKHVLQLISREEVLPGSHLIEMCAILATGLSLWGRPPVFQYITLNSA